MAIAKNARHAACGIDSSADSGMVPGIRGVTQRGANGQSRERGSSRLWRGHPCTATAARQMSCRIRKAPSNGGRASLNGGGRALEQAGVPLWGAIGARVRASVPVPQTGEKWKTKMPADGAHGRRRRHSWSDAAPARTKRQVGSFRRSQHGSCSARPRELFSFRASSTRRREKCADNFFCWPRLRQIAGTFFFFAKISPSGTESRLGALI